MDQLVRAAERIAARTLQDHLARGGSLMHGTVPVPIATFASAKGVLPAVMFMAEEFFTDKPYKFPFPRLRYEADSSAYTGYTLVAIEPDNASSPVINMLAVILKDEMFQPLTRDITQLIENFKDWCADNVQANTNTPSDTASTPPRPE